MVRRFEWLYSRSGKVLVDTIVLAIALGSAYLLRFGSVLPPDYLAQLFGVGTYVLLMTLASLAALGAYGSVWRFTDVRDVVRIGVAIAVPGAILLMLRFVLVGELPLLRLPVSVIALYTSLGCIGAAGVRAVRRLAYERIQHHRAASGTHLRRIAVVGAGEVGMRFAKHIEHRADVRLLAFIDDDSRLQYTRVAGIPVRGTTADLARIAVHHRIDEVLIGDVDPADIRRVVELCEAIPVRVRMLGRKYEFPITNEARARDIRIDDLLGRDVVRLDLAKPTVADTYRGRAVLVTGAGGSIGSELCRQLLPLTPSTLLLVDHDENNLFEIYSDLVHLGCDPSILRRHILDVRREPDVRRLFAAERPEVVLHAAAFKHVPLLESHVVEAVENNALATLALARIADETRVRTFVLISTDKAVLPTSVMGATKRAAELVVQYTAASAAYTRYSCVRFGNVLDSRGSVVPIFRRQIARGGPITITHPEATRYFMTIEEASKFVLQAGALGRRGEVFVLDMGKPVRIVELARDLIRLSGLQEDEIPIAFVGLRPGERLHEQLNDSGSELRRTEFEKVLAASSSVVIAERLEELIERLGEGVRRRDEAALLEALTAEPIGLDRPVPSARVAAPLPFRNSARGSSSG